MTGDDLLERHRSAFEDVQLDAVEGRDPAMLYPLRRSNRFYESFVAKVGLECCYTVAPDTNGDFWAFDYVTTNGTTVMRRRSRCASYAAAKKRARGRAKSAGGKALTIRADGSASSRS
jgi:hypothetical protein